MESRGQKRPDMVDELPADKRPCSSLDFRPSSSNSSVQTHMNSIVETHDHDMDTSSSASASSQSEGDPEKDSTYGSCDSDDMEQQHNSTLYEYHRRRLSSDHGKFKNIICSLSEQIEPSCQLAVLTELCEVLSFCTEGSLSSMTSDLLSPLLVKLAKDEKNPDIMLFSIRAITYICDLYPRSAGFLVQHDAVPTLCQRLFAIEYQDVAEQCLQALEKISREQPLACLEAGAIMAVLNYIDFFSTSIQRVALSTVVNICKKLPSESPSLFMEAVPILCKLLQYEDRQLVENVATCLIKIVERVVQSSEMLDELCKHGLIQQVTHLLSSNGQTALSQLIYNGLIGLLVKLSSGSLVAFRTLYELNISSILREILSTFDLSHGVSTSQLVGGHCNRVYEALKLLNELLPDRTKDQNDQLVLDKDSFLDKHPDLLQRLGIDVFPMLIQVFNSGASLFVCHGCLSVMYKIVSSSKSDMLVELLKNANISSFLAGVFTRKDHHMLLLALQIAEIILHNFSDNFLKLFIKEGVFFAIDALLMPERSSKLMYPVFSGFQLSLDSSQKFSSRETLKCLCYAFSTGQSPTSSEARNCKLDKDSVYNLAEHIKTKYLAPELFDSEKGLTDILQNLRALSNDLLSMSTDNGALAVHEEKINNILYEIMDKLTGKEQVSTFEFIESGVVKSLGSYLSLGQYMRENKGVQGVCKYNAVIEKRFETFASVCASQHLSSETPISILIRNLQTALTSLEAFPIILSSGPKLRNSFATVPNRCSIPYPCLKIRFVRGEGETFLNDYTEDFHTVDPFSCMRSIEAYLWPKVSSKSTEHSKSSSIQAVLQLESPPIQSSHAISVPVDMMMTDFPDTQKDEQKLWQPRTDQVVIMNAGESSSSINQGYAVQELQMNAEPNPKLEKPEPAVADSPDSTTTRHDPVPPTRKRRRRKKFFTELNAPSSTRRSDVAKDCDVEALIAISVGFPVDSLTEEEIEANVVSTVGGSEQSNYIVVRNHILARWRSNVSVWLTHDRALRSIRSEHKGLVETAYRFLLEHGYINFGLAQEIKTLKLKPFDGSDRGTVIVIGAGFAGLVAARQLVFMGFKVVILEGRTRPGGRVKTKKISGDGVEAAADFGGSVLTGINGNPLGVLARQLGLPLHKVRDICPLYLPDGRSVDSEVDSRVEVSFNKLLERVCKLRQAMIEEVKSVDVPLGTALEAFRRVYKVAEDKEERMLLNWHLANLEYANATLMANLSMAYWDQDDPYEMGGDHCFIPGGNETFVRALAEDLPIFYGRTVECVKYGSDGVAVSAGGMEFRGDMVLCTVPLGVLKKGDIEFVPELPQRKKDAIRRLGFGLLNKVAMLFPYNFWGGDIDTFGHLTEDLSMRGEFFLFYSYSSVSGGPLLVALVAGEAAIRFEMMSPVESVKRVLDILKDIFNPKGIVVPDPVQAVCTRWGKDHFAYGSYSYVAVGSSGDDYDILGENVGNGRVFFAGEATCKQYPATMHGAFLSGMREAANILRVAKRRSSMPGFDTSKSNSQEDDDLHKLFLKPDMTFGSFSALYDPKLNDLDSSSLLRVKIGGAVLDSGNLYLYALLSKKRVIELSQVEGDENRMRILNRNFGVSLVGRKGLSGAAESLILSIKLSRPNFHEVENCLTTGKENS